MQLAVGERTIRFRFSPAKAEAAILHMLESGTQSDLHTILKSCYFADKSHLNKYHRPIFGATYRAMKFGPVPLEIYEMLKSEPMWLSELGVTSMPWCLIDGYRIRKIDNRLPDATELSQSDLAEIDVGYKLSSSLTFNSRTALTHGKDWQAANLGRMRYEDMLDESPDKQKIVAYLREAGPFMKL